MRILGVAAQVPERVLRTEDVARAASPPRDPVELERRIGIQQRRWWEQERAVDLGASVLSRALHVANADPGQLRTLIFTSSVGGDYLIPSNASPIAAAAGASPDCACFDVNNACLGFLTSLDLAARLVQGHGGLCGVVSVELFHRYLAPHSPRSWAVFGDGAAAAIVGPGQTGALLASDLGNDGRRVHAATLEVEALTGQPEQLRFGVSGAQILEYALEDMQESVGRVLRASGMAIDEVDWFFPHQPNGPMFDLFVERFGGPRARHHKVVHELGSLGSASIPVSLAAAWDQVKDGQHLLLAAVGGGTSRGALLLRVQR